MEQEALEVLEQGNRQVLGREVVLVLEREALQVLKCALLRHLGAKAHLDSDSKGGLRSYWKRHSGLYGLKHHLDSYLKAFRNPPLEMVYHHPAFSWVSTMLLTGAEN